MLDFLFNWLEGGMKVQPRKPDQHENQLAALERIEQALKKPQLPIKIEVTCKCPADSGVLSQILEIVKDIQKRIQEGGISEAEEKALAEKLSAATDSLSGAVEANQPPTT
jgi:vacuolar-type H+-ATPase subunit I/STV1